MTSKFLNISTDKNLGGNSPSDMAVPSQKAVKDYSDKRLLISDQGTILPNFDAMPVLATYEYDVSDTSWKQLFTRTNTETAEIDLQDVVYCRITVTGTNISAKYDCAFYWKGQLAPFQILVMSYPGTTNGNYCGIRYMRAVYPKALNNGYPWVLDFVNYNNTARHFKIEVFKTNSKITWMSTATGTTYNGTYHSSSQFTIQTNRGLCSNDTILYGYVNNSSWSNSINGQINKYTVNNTMPLTGAALLANQFTFMNGNKIYPATNKTLAVEPSFGITFNVTAYNNNVTVGWDRFRDRQRVTSLTNIPHATLARGDNCYFRCTTDANGNIYSDNYVSNQMTAGYTWYYVGLAESNTTICICTTGSHFLTLDSSGKLTAVDGKLIAGADTSDCVKLTGNQTIAGTKTFNSAIKAKGGFDVINGAVTKGTNPSSTQYWGLFRANDKNDGTGTWQSTRLGIGEVSLNTNGKTNLMLGVYRNATDSGTNSSINIGYDLTTGAYATAPAPREDTTSSTQIDTVGARNTKLANYVPTSRKINNKALSSDITLTATDVGALPSSTVIPAAQVNSDWNATSGVAKILNKPETSQVHVVIDTYKKGSSWYRIYDDGWVEQGGRITGNSGVVTTTLLKSFIDANYILIISSNNTNDVNPMQHREMPYDMTSNNFKSYWGNSNANIKSWYACGMGEI